MYSYTGPHLSAAAPSTNMLLSRVTVTATGNDLVRFGAEGMRGGGGGLQHDVHEEEGRLAG